MSNQENSTVLILKNISKSFSGNLVLDSVNFDIKEREIHALLGENGAGKSTLLNILTGTFKMDEGEIYLKGKKVEIRGLTSARDMGIVRVHQELQVIPEMTVGQNIFLGREPKTRLGLIDYDEIYRQSDEILNELDADFSSKELIKNLSTAQMQMVEISKALHQNFLVLALDEPTSSLTSNEIDKLMSTMDQLRKQGKSIIYISHRIEEVFRIADRATVLRDGKLMGTVDIDKISKQELIRLMVGRNITDQKFNEKYVGTNETILEVQNLCGKGFSDVSFSLRKGEVLGFSGLIGAGRTEVARSLFGIDRASSGTIILKGKNVSIKNPWDARKYGIMLIPEDRKLQGMVGTLANKNNITLSNLSRYKKNGIILHNKIAADAWRYVNLFQINPPDIEIETRFLSGGNQQKVVLSRNLNTEPDILILDEPTRGIDINVKFEIYKLIRQLAEEGKSIIMISSELPEIISLCDRVIVMYEGKVQGELLNTELSEELIMTYAMGEYKK